jgi:group I intron endonuclease
MNKIIGIYKITSPNNNVYIGQSNNIHKRFYLYKKLRCKSQIKLYNSFLKYGQENHKFDILCECNTDELNNLEIKYIKEYNSFNSKNGLNLKSGGNSGGCLSDESKEKIRQKAKGRISKIKGIPKSEETKLKLSLINKGKKHSQERKIKQSLLAKERGFKPPIMTRDKYTLESLQKKKDNWSKEKNPNYKNKLMTDEHKKSC